MFKNKKCKNNKKRSKIFAIFLIVDFLSVFFTLYYFSTKTIISIGVSEYRSLLSSSAYYAITNSVNDKIKYEDIIKVYKNDNGEVTMITANSYKVNVLTSSVANDVNYYLTQKTRDGVDVPIGVFTGIKLFYGFGKKVKIPLITINSVKCDVISEFESAGINQTRHSIYLNVIPEVNIVTRFKTEILLDSIKILVFDNYIVGKVPEIFINGNGLSAKQTKNVWQLPLKFI